MTCQLYCRQKKYFLKTRFNLKKPPPHSLSSALAKHTSCLCPTERFSPPSATGWSSPRSSPRANSLRWACPRADHRRSSADVSNGSRLERRVPVKSTGSCGMMVMALLRAPSPMREMSTPSTEMDPEAASTMRNRDRVSEDLPAPVRPTMPT